jgi:hypothetical protein
MKVLTLRFDAELHEVHLLNVGEMFPPDFDPEKHTGFGGSRHPLVAGHDFDTGKKRKNPTASLVIRRMGPMGVHDIERDITDPHFWAWMARMLNGEGPDEALVEIPPG